MEGSEVDRYYLGIDVFGRVAKRYDEFKVIEHNGAKKEGFSFSAIEMASDLRVDTDDKDKYMVAVKLYNWYEVPYEIWEHFCFDDEKRD